MKIIKRFLIMTFCYLCCVQLQAQVQQEWVQRFTATCFIATVAEVPGVHRVATPVVAGIPPSLNEPSYVPPTAANALYLHDLAVHPRARGSGAAAALVAAYFHTLRLSQAPFGCLTAVNQSSTYWERHGFRSTSVADAEAGCMDTYGEGAQSMSLRVSV